MFRETPTALYEKRSPHLALYGLGSTAIAHVGHTLQMRTPQGWRGNGGIWDVWSHAGNVSGTVMTVSAATLAAAWLSDNLFRTMPLKQAFGVAAIGLTVGYGFNIAVETPTLADTALVRTLLPAGSPDEKDVPYGGLAALGEAELLAWAASKRSADS